MLKPGLETIRRRIWRVLAIPDPQTDRLFYKAGAFIAGDRIEGDYLEFGVFTGNSFIAAYRLLERAFYALSTPDIWNTADDCRQRRELWERMRFFAFDGFRGLPPLHGPDAGSRDFVHGKFAASEAEFRWNVAGAGIPSEKVVVVGGWFDETLTPGTRDRHGMRSAAIVHVDCDLYESARRVLEFVTPLLVDGTVLIFNDWYNFRGNPALGEQRACAEWLSAHPEIGLSEYQKEGPWTRSFIVHRKP